MHLVISSLNFFMANKATGFLNRKEDKNQNRHRQSIDIFAHMILLLPDVSLDT